jgi:hypothetical protein
MRRALGSAKTLLHHNVLHSAPHSAPPVVLCPALLRTAAPIASRRSGRIPSAKGFATTRRTCQQAAAESNPTEGLRLPRSCPGCGAPTQLYDKKEAGFYNVDRNAVRDYLTWNTPSAAGASPSSEDHVYSIALRSADPALLEELGVSKDGIKPPTATEAPATPVCDRCHDLIHHRIGTPIHHPTVESIQHTISESPHRRNHIYHVVDAADFPLSLVPNLQSSLRIPKLRTQNRRAKHKGWVANDRIAEVSFIITRADLLAPKKEQVDALMPYIMDVLRDALGRDNNKARLGNVRLVSAKRGWWTRQVKDDIWERGGAGWMVGKVNVGKSNLFEAVFPKGRGADYQDVRKIRSAAEREAMLNNAKSLEDLAAVQRQLSSEDAEIERRKKQPPQHLHQPPRASELEPEEEDDYEDPDALLPPAQPFTLFPVLPIASSLPGTTASPIRIPFGRNRGELVDLPGLARTTPGLETFVQPTEHDSLIMKSRMNAERFSLKPGQSLILGGGLVRITPVTDDLVFLVHPFVPIHPHVTRTDKAIAYQSQESDRQLQVPPILAPGAGSKMNSAGRFALKWDVTKKLSGALTSPVAAKMKPENLPFRIWSTDILIEGVGWVEVSAQTRRPAGWKPKGMTKKDPNHAQKAKEAHQRDLKAWKDAKFADALSSEPAASTSTTTLPSKPRPRDAFDELAPAPAHDDYDAGDDLPPWDQHYPEIEVFSPLGKFVGARRPMCASAVAGPRVVSSRERTARPRRSMVSVKRQRKAGE